MRPLRVTFTLRRMMVAVVAAAMLVLVKPLWDRARWSRIAAYYARQAEIYLSRAR